MIKTRQLISLSLVLALTADPVFASLSGIQPSSWQTSPVKYKSLFSGQAFSARAAWQQRVSSINPSTVRHVLTGAFLTTAGILGSVAPAFGAVHKGKDIMQAAAGQALSTTIGVPEVLTHTVAAGENLTWIAQAHTLTLQKLLELNPSFVSHQNTIFPNDVLKVGESVIQTALPALPVPPMPPQVDLGAVTQLGPFSGLGDMIATITSSPVGIGIAAVVSLGLIGIVFSRYLRYRSTPVDPDIAFRQRMGLRGLAAVFAVVAMVGGGIWSLWPGSPLNKLMDRSPAPAKTVATAPSVAGQPQQTKPMAQTTPKLSDRTSPAATPRIRVPRTTTKPAARRAAAEVKPLQVTPVGIPAFVPEAPALVPEKVIEPVAPEPAIDPEALRTAEAAFATAENQAAQEFAQAIEDVDSAVRLEGKINYRKMFSLGLADRVPDLGKPTEALEKALRRYQGSHAVAASDSPLSAETQSRIHRERFEEHVLVRLDQLMTYLKAKEADVRKRRAEVGEKNFASDGLEKEASAYAAFGEIVIRISSLSAGTLDDRAVVVPAEAAGEASEAYRTHMQDINYEAERAVASFWKSLVNYHLWGSSPELSWKKQHYMFGQAVQTYATLQQRAVDHRPSNVSEASVKEMFTARFASDVLPQVIKLELRLKKHLPAAVRDADAKTLLQGSARKKLSELQSFLAAVQAVRTSVPEPPVAPEVEAVPPITALTDALTYADSQAQRASRHWIKSFAPRNWDGSKVLSWRGQHIALHKAVTAYLADQKAESKETDAQVLKETALPMLEKILSDLKKFEPKLAKEAEMKTFLQGKVVRRLEALRAYIAFVESTQSLFNGTPIVRTAAPAVVTIEAEAGAVTSRLAGAIKESQSIRDLKARKVFLNEAAQAYHQSRHAVSRADVENAYAHAFRRDILPKLDKLLIDLAKREERLAATAEIKTFGQGRYQRRSVDLRDFIQSVEQLRTGAVSSPASPAASLSSFRFNLNAVFSFPVFSLLLLRGAVDSPLTTSLESLTPFLVWGMGLGIVAMVGGLIRKWIRREPSAPTLFQLHKDRLYKLSA